MKVLYWYSIAINKNECTAFEHYLKTITRGLQYTAYQFTAYRTTESYAEIVTYYIAEEIEYLQAFIKHRYQQIRPCSELEKNKIVSVNFSKM